MTDLPSDVDNLKNYYWADLNVFIFQISTSVLSHFTVDLRDCSKRAPDS